MNPAEQGGVSSGLGGGQGTQVSQPLSTGGILPPTPEDYRRMWEEQSKQMKPQDYERESEANKRKARKEVFQEAVQRATAADSRLVDTFHSNINITEPSTQKNRPRKKRG